MLDEGVGRRDHPRAAKALRRPLLALPRPAGAGQFEEAASGRFSGVGLTVTGVKRGLRVASVLPDTPAERAGIEEGDLITAVDGRSLAGVPAEVSTARIKGPPGTRVELRVVSAPGADPQRQARARLGGAPGRPGGDQASGHRQGRLRPVRELQVGGARRAPGRRSSASTAAAPRAWCSICGTTAAGC